jgi:hypothetical protein
MVGKMEPKKAFVEVELFDSNFEEMNLHIEKILCEWIPYTKNSCQYGVCILW